MSWRNELGGMTFAVEGTYVKWNPLSTGVDLASERERMQWLAQHHPAPRVIDFGSDDDAQWLITEALPGEHAVSDRWKARPSEAIRAIAVGLRRLHAIPVDDVPTRWTSWIHHSPADLGERPSVETPTLVHGDACAPNTIISVDGSFVGHVDLGEMAVGDRWADLAIASMSLDWNFGEGYQDSFFTAYGIGRDEDRIRYYRDLWHHES